MLQRVSLLVTVSREERSSLLPFHISILVIEDMYGSGYGYDVGGTYSSAPFKSIVSADSNLGAHSDDCTLTTDREPTEIRFGRSTNVRY